MRLPGVEGFHPLSPMQQGMLFHSLSAPGSALYWQQVTLTLEGPLDLALLKRSWERVIERHAVLRSYFVWEGLKEPIQVVQRNVSLPTEEHDWRSLDPGRRAAELEAWLEADRAKGCNLGKAPLLRLTVVRLEQDLQYVIWSFHHVILDGWSVYRVLKDVFETYEAERRGEPLDWAPGRPYQDYIAWLRGQDLRRAEDFWRRELSGLPGPTAVADALAPVGQATGDGRIVEVDTQVVRLHEAASAAAQSFAKQHRLTMNTLLQGAWALLLSRYSGQADVCFGGTVSGRPAEIHGVESMVGMFINTLPVRTRVPPRAELLPWLQDLQGRQADARHYDWTPLVEIQGWSGIPRDVPLFDSIFIFANYPVELWSSLGGGSLTVKGYRALESTNYPLNAFAEPGPQLALGLFYDRDRCERAAVSRLLGHWRILLEAMIGNPRARLAELPMLGSHEIAELERWNATASEDNRGACLPDLFEAQVARTPDAAAVAFGVETLSYRELNRRANCLAHELRGLGVRPGVLVGIYMERSQDMLVALLGVLKAGGAYVPLDPAYPKERVSYMLEDSGTAILLTQQALLGTLPEPASKVVCVDAHSSEAGADSDAEPARTIAPDDLAYVIYTSGSTGRPKGVQVTHRGLVNFLTSMRHEPGMSERDTLLSVTTLSFDIAGLELYLPLIVGGRVVLASRVEAADGRMLLAKLKAFDVTLMQATPATWRLLLEAEWGVSGTLKVLCGGESLTRELADRLLERGASLWNLYGPTETTIWSTLAKVHGAGPVTIGRPIANTRVHVLDAQGERVPVGVAGELCIGGDGLARGYLRQPELTAEKFVPDPFGHEPGARLYKTGDLARYRPDGTIEWLGRGDHQVKLRGYRIELGEIESLLSRHPEVRSAVAVLREDVPGDPRLTGYVVARGGARDGETGSSRPELAGRLRRHLQGSLPDFMVPGGFVVLDELPLTPNGKVDRRALPRPDTAAPSTPFHAPETATDQAIASVWREVLHVERVGLHDNFFDHGGHSLLLMQVQGKLRRLLDREIAIVDLFRYPTVAALSRHLEGDSGRGGAPRLEAGTIEKLQAGRQRLDRLRRGSGAPRGNTGQLR